MAKYSMRMEARFMPRLTRMAISVDTPSRMEMKNGPASLQMRSIRRICAFRTGTEVRIIDVLL